MLAAALVTLLAVGPATAAAPCGDVWDVSGLRLGPQEAPIAVEAYVDPARRGSLTTWLELRRLSAELQGRVTITAAVVRDPGLSDPRAVAVREFALVAAAQGRLLEVLRQLARDGFERVYARLSTPQERAALDKEVGIRPRGQARARRCAGSWLDQANRSVRGRFSQTGNAGFRLPVFAVAPDDPVAALVFEDAPSLERLRPELARLRQRQRKARRRKPTPVPQARAASARLRRPRLKGALLGGVGLRHRFVLMGRAEDDPNLFMLLPPVLKYRREHPGALAVQIVARGGSLGGQTLRHRLCSARKLGRVVEYVQYLATEPSLRRGPPSAQASLLKELDAVGEKACTDDPDPAELGLPDGGWLDGIPRTRSELEALPTTLRLLDAARRPLTPLIAPPTDEL